MAIVEQEHRDRAEKLLVGLTGWHPAEVCVDGHAAAAHDIAIVALALASVVHAIPSQPEGGKGEVTQAHRDMAIRLWNAIVCGDSVDTIAQALAAAESRGRSASAEQRGDGGREAAWAVEVLDAWAAKCASRNWQCTSGWIRTLATDFKHLDQGDARTQLSENGEPQRAWFADTPTLARIAAARELAELKSALEFLHDTSGLELQNNNLYTEELLSMAAERGWTPGAK